MAQSLIEISRGVRQVVVRMPDGLRVLLGFATLLGVVGLNLGALVIAGPVGASVTGIACISWIVGLRGLHQRIVFAPDRITFRNMYVTRTVDSSDVIGGWLRYGGGVAVLLLKNQTYAYFDTGDWRNGARRAEERAAILASVADEVGASYAERLGEEEDIVGSLGRPATMRELQTRFAPLLVSEWAAIAVSLGLMAYELAAGG